MSLIRPRIVPVVEAPGHPESWPWSVGDLVPYDYFELRMSPSEAEIGSVVASLCRHIEPDNGDTITTILARLMELDSFNLPGGLGILNDGKLELTPGCCCGIEEWRELLTIPEGDSPWLGHDPSPWCIPTDDGVRFAADAEADNCIEMSLPDVVHDLRQFHVTLEQFIHSLEAWLLSQGVTETEEFIRKFDISFSITADGEIFSADR